MVEKSLFLFMVGNCLGEWIRIPDTGGVEYSNDYSDEYNCARIHNLTMMSFADSKDAQSCESNTREERSDGDLLDALRKKIQHQIGARIQDLGSWRHSRTHHIGFPSMESALISISLLIIAVYLIKLVLKLMQTLSNKKGTTDFVRVFTGMPPAMSLVNGRVGSLDEELKFWEILNLTNDSRF